MSLRKTAIRGIKWTTVSTLTIAVINLIKISVLARFLDKSDFGLMALVTFVLGFMNLFMDMGLSSAILHKQGITNDEYASLYWINIIFSLILFIVIFIVSPFIARFYKEFELIKLIPLMSLSIMLSALGKQFRTIEQKELHFKYLAFTDITGAFSGLLVGIILAVVGRGVYALVFASLAHYTVSNGILFLKGLHSRGLKFHLKYTETKPFLRIGIYQVGGQIVNYFSRDLDVLLIGKFFGTDILGGYSLAKEFVRRPMQVINPIISRVAMALFPRYQNDHPSLRRYFINLFTGMGALNAFIFGSIAIFASKLVLLFFGQDFLPIAIYLQLFSLVIYLRSMGNLVSIVVITTGRTDYEFYWNIVSSIVIPLAIIIGAHFSVEMIIIILGLLQLALIIPGWYLFYYKLINLKFAPYIKSTLIPLIISIIIFLTGKIFSIDNLLGQIFLFSVLIILLAIYSYIKLSEVRNFVKLLYNKNFSQ